MILMIPIVSSELCKEELLPVRDCLMTTPTIVGCGTFTYDIINVTDGALLVNGSNLTLVNEDVYSLNFSQPIGDYVVRLCENSTREVQVVGERENMGIAPILMVIFMAIAFFGLGFGLKKEEWKWSTEALRLLFFFLGIFMLNIGIILAREFASIAGTTTNVLDLMGIIYIVTISISVFIIMIMITLYIIQLVKITRNAIQQKKDGGDEDLGEL